MRLFKRFRHHFRRKPAQALVEFALVLMLIITTMVGGVLTIQALFLQQRLIDIVTRAAQWGATTNSDEQMYRILAEACTFSRNVQITITPKEDKTSDDKRDQVLASVCIFSRDVPTPITAKEGRKIGDKLIVEVQAKVPLLGAGVALEANIGARSVVLVEHGPMRFGPPQVDPPQVSIGSYVRIQTTAGESLNVRRQPGLRAATFWSLFNGNTAIVIDGPVLVDGLRWWKVERRLNGQVLSGWCVDKADTVDTLIPLERVF
jgi:hypothetical protein